MKKIFSILAAVLFAGSMMADVVTLDPATQTPQTTETDINLTIQGVTVSYHGSLNAATDYVPADFRIYGGQTLKLSAGSQIVKVVIAGKANKDGFTLSTNKGTVTTGASYDKVTEKAALNDPLIVVSNINNKSVTLTCGKQLRAYMIEVTLGEGGGDDPGEGETITLDVDYADAMWITDEDGDYWQFNLYKDYDSSTGAVTYPDFYVGVEPKAKTALAGIYTVDDIFYVEVDVAKGTTVEATSFSDLQVTYIKPDTYRFNMTFVGDDGNNYILDATLDVEAYDYETEEDIVLMEYGGGEDAVDNVVIDMAPVKTIKNGTLFIERNGVRYNVVGQIVR